MNIASAINLLSQSLKSQSQAPVQDAQVLLAHLLNTNRTYLIAHPEQPLTSNQQTTIEHALTETEKGTPLPYIIGVWPFYGRDFTVTPDVLIPRPETELLIHTALEWLKSNPSKRTAIDVGTGSGIIPITLACEISNLQLEAIDISPSALAIAQKNAKQHQVEDRIKFVENNLLTNFTSQSDLLCANLPYIPSPRLPQLAVTGKEPSLALNGGLDGLDLIRTLVTQAKTCLAPSGLLLLEIDDSHGQSAAQLVQSTFPKATVQVQPDLGGKPRLLVMEHQS